MVSAYYFLPFLHAGLNLRDMTLRLIIDSFLDLIFVDDTKLLARV